MTVVLDIASAGGRMPLRVRPWLAADMPDLLAAMAREIQHAVYGRTLMLAFQGRSAGPGRGTRRKPPSGSPVRTLAGKAATG